MRIMTEVAVATTLVRLARSKIVSDVITSRTGSTARAPYAFRQTTFPSRPTSTTAPGNFLSAIASAMTASIWGNRNEDTETDSGLTIGTCAATDCASQIAIKIRVNP